MKITDSEFKKCLKEIDDLKNQRIKLAVDRVKFEELKPNSTYVVKFDECIRPDVMSSFMKQLKEMTEDLNITWIASSPLFEISKAISRGVKFYEDFAGENNKENE